MWDFLKAATCSLQKKKNGILDDQQHLAEMVSPLGPPPPEFLIRSKNCYQYWDSKGIAPIPCSFVLDKYSVPVHNLLMSSLGNWKGSVPRSDS